MNLTRLLLVALLAYFSWNYFTGLKKISSPVAFQLEYKVSNFGPEVDGPLKTLFYFHGSGGTEEGSLHRFKNIDFPLRVISFRGPGKRGRGYDWSKMKTAASVQEADRLFEEDQKSIALSVAYSVPEFLEKYQIKGKPYAAGFSSGAVVVYAIAALEPMTFEALYPISGSVPKNVKDSISLLSDSTRLIAFHGKEDRIKSISHVRKEIENFTKAGASATLVELNGGHQVLSYAFPLMLEDIKN